MAFKVEAAGGSPNYQPVIVMTIPNGATVSNEIALAPGFAGATSALWFDAATRLAAEQPISLQVSWLDAPTPADWRTLVAALFTGTLGTAQSGNQTTFGNARRMRLVSAVPVGGDRVFPVSYRS